MHFGNLADSFGSLCIALHKGLIQTVAGVDQFGPIGGTQASAGLTLDTEKKRSKRCDHPGVLVPVIRKLPSDRHRLERFVCQPKEERPLVSPWPLVCLILESD